MMTLIPFDDPISPGEVAQHLKRMRKLAGFTQRRAAERMGMKPRTYVAWESGVNLEHFCAVAAMFESFGCTVIFKPPTQST